MIYMVKFINVANLMITLFSKGEVQKLYLVHYPFSKSESEKQDRRKYDEKNLQESYSVQ